MKRLNHLFGTTSIIKRLTTAKTQPVFMNTFKNYHTNIARQQSLDLGVVFAWSGLHERMNSQFIEKREELLNNEIYPKYGVEKKDRVITITKQNRPTVEQLKEMYKDCKVLLVCPMTGGTEELLKDLVALKKPIVLFGESYHNAIAASLELRQYFRNYMIPSVLVNKTGLIHKNLEEFSEKYDTVWKKFLDLRLGLIGEISPWLINEKDFVVDESLQNGTQVVTPAFRLPFVKISSKELYETFRTVSESDGREVAEIVSNMQLDQGGSKCCGGSKKNAPTSNTGSSCQGNGSCGSGSCSNNSHDHSSEHSHEHSCAGDMSVCSPPSTSSSNYPSVASNSLVEACRVYLAIHKILQKYKLDGFTIGCFDLIGDLKTTPCLALALLNGIKRLQLKDGTVLEMKASACEGELNSLLAMIVCQQFLNKSPFMANIVDYHVSESGMEDELLIAHCTAPLVPGLPFELTTHFESGIGVAVKVDMPALTQISNIKRANSGGNVVPALGASQACATILKVKNNKEVIMAPVMVYDRETSLLRCRTQLRLRMPRVEEFVNSTYGNHHLLVYENFWDVRDKFELLGFHVTEHL